MARAAISIVIYSRANCGLCQRAYERAQKEARRTAIQFIDIDSDEQLTRRYGVRVPVVEVNGREVAEFELLPGVLRAAIRAARKGR